MDERLLFVTMITSLLIIAQSKSDYFLF